MPHEHGNACDPPRLRVHGPAQQPPWAHVNETTGEIIDSHDRGSRWTCECGLVWVLRESREASHEFLPTRRLFWESQS